MTPRVDMIGIEITDGIQEIKKTFFDNQFSRLPVYEETRDNYIEKMDESYIGKNIPTDMYGLSKYIMNEYARNSRNIVNLRLFGVFGKYEDYRIRFISNNICRVLAGNTISINQNVFFDYIFNVYIYHMK